MIAETFFSWIDGFEGVSRTLADTAALIRAVNKGQSGGGNQEALAMGAPLSLRMNCCVRDELVLRGVKRAS